MTTARRLPFLGWGSDLAGGEVFAGVVLRGGLLHFFVLSDTYRLTNLDGNWDAELIDIDEARELADLLLGDRAGFVELSSSDGEAWIVVSSRNPEGPKSPQDETPVEPTQYDPSLLRLGCDYLLFQTRGQPGPMRIAFWNQEERDGLGRCVRAFLKAYPTAGA